MEINTKVIAIIRGGVLESFITNSYEIDLTVIDYDNKSVGDMAPDSVMTADGIEEYIKREERFFVIQQIANDALRTEAQDEELNVTDDYQADITDYGYKTIMSVSKRFADGEEESRGWYVVGDYEYESSDEAREDLQRLVDIDINIKEKWED